MQSLGELFGDVILIVLNSSVSPVAVLQSAMISTLALGIMLDVALATLPLVFCWIALHSMDIAALYPMDNSNKTPITVTKILVFINSSYLYF